jgi:hypothetical protein
LPLPLAPDVTVIQLALLTAVHAHPAAAVTATEPEAPAAPMDWLVGESDGAQSAGVNGFERALGVLPPGPTATTLDS